jgi:hypothetical protein
MWIQLPGGGEELFCARGKSSSRRVAKLKDSQESQSSKGDVKDSAQDFANASQRRVFVFRCPGVHSRMSDIHIKYQQTYIHYTTELTFEHFFCSGRVQLQQHLSAE